MRRAELALPPEECRAVLKRGDYGTIAMLGADGAPYAVPVNCQALICQERRGKA